MSLNEQDQEFLAKLGQSDQTKAALNNFAGYIAQYGTALAATGLAEDLVDEMLLDAHYLIWCKLYWPDHTPPSRMG